MQILVICFLLLVFIRNVKSQEPQLPQQQQLFASTSPLVDPHQLLIDQLYQLSTLAGNFSTSQQVTSNSNNSNSLPAALLLAPLRAQLLAASRRQQQQFINSTLSSTTNNNIQRTRSPPVDQHQHQHQHQLQRINHNINPNGSRVSLTRLTSQQQVAEHHTGLLAVRQKWRNMESSLGESMSAFSHRLRSIFDELMKQQVGKQQQVSSQCSESITYLLDSLATQKLWASQTIDASARLPSGMLEGTLTELGNFDQCLGVQEHSRRNQYCSVVIKPPLLARTRLHTICQRLPALSVSASLASTTQGSFNSSSARVFRLLSQNSHHFYYAGLRLGLCLPSSCSKQDLQLLLTAYLSKAELLVQVKSCQVSTSTDGQQLEGLDLVQQCIVSTFVGLLILSGVGTFVDFITSNKRSLVSAKRFNSNTFTATRDVIGSFRLAATTDEIFNVSQQRRQQHEQAKQPSKLTAYLDRPPQAAARRWQYQVYQSSKFDNGDHPCQLHRHNHQSPGIQHNPLADGYPSSCDNSAQPTTSPSISSSLNSSHQTEKSLPETSLHTSTVDCNLEESWLNEFEQAQRQMNGIHLKKSGKTTREISFKQDAVGINKQKQLIPGGLISFLCCFSIKKNLQIIGKHANVNKPKTTAGDEKIADIEVIHGLRTITMIWIIFGHTVGLVNPDMMNNLFSLAQLSCSSRFLQAILNATLAVNTFFMISGLVTAVSLARKCKSVSSLVFSSSFSSHKRASLNEKNLARENVERSQRDELYGNSRRCKNGIDLDDLSSVDSSSSIIQSPPSSSSSTNLSYENEDSQLAPSVKTRRACHGSKQKRIIASEALRQKRSGTIWPTDFQPLVWLSLRYLRLSPAYAAIIGISILLPALGSGPYWQETVGEMGPVCRINWWSNLLYVNNFIGTEQLCLIHSWYLSNDFQFFIISLLILSIFYLSRKIACLLIITLIAASSATTFALTMLNDFPPTIVTTSPAVSERWTFIHSLYYKPWPHLPSYLIGLCTGYLLLIREKLPLEMSATSRALGWFLFSLLALALLNSIYPWNMGLQVDPLLTSLHSSTFRSLWATCCAWLVFALATRPHCWLSKFMSWHGFQVTSRLTYCAYLVHPLIIYYHFGALRERLDSSPYGQVHRFMATLMLSYLFALLLAIFIESPSVQLQRLITSIFSSGNTKDQHITSSSQFPSAVLADHQLIMRLEKKTNTNHLITSHGDGSSADSTVSWTGASSVGEQSCSALISSAPHTNTATKTVSTNSKHLLDPIDLLRVQYTNTVHHHQEKQQQPAQDQSASIMTAISQPIYSTEEQQKGVAATAHDAEFQRKLAQAISRGFRIRSRLAATTGSLVSRAGTTTTIGKRGLQLKKQFPVELTSSNSHHHPGEQVALGDRASATSVVGPKQSTLRKVEFSTFFMPNQQHHHNHSIMSRSQKQQRAGGASFCKEDYKSAKLTAKHT